MPIGAGLAERSGCPHARYARPGSCFKPAEQGFLTVMAGTPPTKPLDRAKPFKRINNDKFLVKTSPDGFGVHCGCHTPADLGDIDKEFLDFSTGTCPFPS